MKAAYEALGGDPEHLEMLIMQLVHLVRRGERAQMSKRAGEFVTLDDLLREIGVDAARWFLLSRSHDTTIDLDLDLAREQSNENPVYYVQYAHARIASMLAKAGAEQVERALCGAWGRASGGSAPSRAQPDQEAARVPGRGRRGGHASRAASDRRLRAGAGPAVHGVLPRLPRARRRVAGARIPAARVVRRLAARRSPARSICSGWTRRRRCSGASDRLAGGRRLQGAALGTSA